MAFQLSEHEKFLSKFLQLFRSVDHENKGLISIDQFVELYKQMNIKGFEVGGDRDNLGDASAALNKETIKFLDILDPYQCDRITLSDIVQLFSSYRVDLKDLKDAKQTPHQNLQKTPDIDRIASS